MFVPANPGKASRTLGFLAVFALFLTSAFSQSARGLLEFEVASIRQASLDDTRVDVGMHIDGSQVRFNQLNLRACLSIAFDRKTWQVIGPDWIDSDRFNIAAKLPTGATQTQVRDMLQNLLLARFHIQFHHEQRDFPVYALTVGKGGLKLKVTPPDDVNNAAGSKSLIDIKGSGSASGVAADLGNGAYFSLADNHFVGHKLPVSRIAELLAKFMDKPVLDMTGLNPSTLFDISLELAPEDFTTMQMRGALQSGITLPSEVARLADRSPESLFAAMATAGLRFESRKAAQDVIVIDHADKTPSDD